MSRALMLPIKSATDEYLERFKHRECGGKTVWCDEKCLICTKAPWLKKENKIL